MQTSQRRMMTMIGAAAVFLAAGWSVYNVVADWPWRYKGGILYERMIQEHIQNSLLQGAALIALPLTAYLYQAFGYERLVNVSSTPYRKTLGDVLFLVATVIAVGSILLSGGGWLLQILMEASPH